MPRKKEVSRQTPNDLGPTSCSCCSVLRQWILPRAMRRAASPAMIKAATERQRYLGGLYRSFKAFSLRLTCSGIWMRGRDVAGRGDRPAGAAGPSWPSVARSWRGFDRVIKWLGTCRPSHAVPQDRRGQGGAPKATKGRGPAPTPTKPEAMCRWKRLRCEEEIVGASLIWPDLRVAWRGFPCLGCPPTLFIFSHDRGLILMSRCRKQTGLVALSKLHFSIAAHILWGKSQCMRMLIE